MNDKTSINRIESNVRRLAATPRHGAENPTEHGAAAEWIASELEAAGCTVDFQEFDIPGQDPPRRGRNVIGLVTGSIGGESGILVGAHYDTVPGSPGADDNASGVAAMLEIARRLTENPPRESVILAAFDAEEKQPPVEGLHGSNAFVHSLSECKMRISAAIILECIGYSSRPGTQSFPAGFQLLFPRAFDTARQSSFAGDSLAVLSNKISRTLSRRFESAARGAGLPTLPVELPGWMRVPYNLRRSDHAPFWEAGIPAIMVGDTANFRNPNYHLPSDIADTIDTALIARVVDSVVSSLRW